MSEKLKVLLGIVGFIIVIIGVAIFMNNRTTTIDNTNKVQEGKNNIIEVDESDFEREVLNSNKKVLIDFYATWCNPCKMLEPIIEEVANENQNLKVVRINVDKNTNLANRYRIQAMPTLVVIENKNEINRSVGAIPKDKILELIK